MDSPHTSVGPSSSSGHCRGTGQSGYPADLKRSRSRGWHAWNINPPVEQAREGLRSSTSTTTVAPTAAPLGSSGMHRTFSAYNAKYLSSCGSNSCNVMVLLGNVGPTTLHCSSCNSAGWAPHVLCLVPPKVVSQISAVSHWHVKPWLSGTFTPAR